MTKEEAGKWLTNLKSDIGKMQFRALWDYAQAIDEIIKLLSAEAEWIPLNKQKSFLMMPDELEAVNITWVNHNPPPYYKYTKDVPLVDSAVYYRGKWYWWDATVIDVLAEYGEDCNAEQIDKDIEVVAWRPMPEPYREGGE